MTIKPCIAIALGFGYVESGKTSWLIYKAEQGSPATRKQALFSLVKYLYAKYQSELEQANSWRDLRVKNKCCKTNIRQNADAKFCSDCGSNISKKQFDVEDWRGFLFRLQKSDCDSYGDHDDVYDSNDFSWTPWMFGFDVQQKNMLIIGENAEHILTEVLKLIHPELADPEDDYNNYVAGELDSMFDETTSFNGHGYYHPKEDDSLVTYTQSHYKNGAVVYSEDDVLTHIKYNTGDIVYFKLKPDGFHEVIKVETHDGIVWDKH